MNLKIRKMTKEQYLKELENLKEVIKNAEKAKTELRDKYIEANKPFGKGTPVKIVLNIYKNGLIIVYLSSTKCKC